MSDGLYSADLEVRNQSLEDVLFEMSHEIERGTVFEKAMHFIEMQLKYLKHKEVFNMAEIDKLLDFINENKELASQYNLGSNND